MLTGERKQTLETIGWVRLPGAFDPADADRMAERVWETLAKKHGFDRENPATSTVARPTGFQSLARSGAFDALFTPQLTEAIDGLLGAGNWERPTGGGTPLISLPGSEPTPWAVLGTQWHLDFPATGEVSSASVARFFALLAPVVSHGGATLVVESSPALIARLAIGKGHSQDVRKALARASPWFRDLFAGKGNLTESAVVEGVSVRVAELTGAAGDAILLHPLALHAPSPNATKFPRMLVSHSIFRTN